METSDSEYFESADEGVDSSESDEETEKSKQSVGQNLTHKTIEPEVCKLKDDEAAKKLSSTPAECISNVGSGKINNKSQSVSEKSNIQRTKNISEEQKDKSQSASEDSNIILTLVSKKCDNKNLVENSKNIVNEKKAQDSSENISKTVIIENDNKKMETPVTLNEFPETVTPVSKATQNILKNALADELDTNLTQESNLKPEKEDNLWNDDEIDWGSEAAKEESLKTEEHSRNSKNEDSGWDDFDVDWQSESPVSLGKTLEDKNEPVGPKQKTALVGGNKKPYTASSVQENLWEDDDDWEPLEKPEDKPKQMVAQSSWGGWGSWDMSSILNTATQGVSNLTSHVSQGLSTVLESGISIPEPEELAKINKISKDNTTPTEPTTQDFTQYSADSPGFGLDNLVLGMSQLTKFVESTGTKVITGGLDTLEAIGKKTVEVLQEGDPGLKKKRAFLKLDTGKPNLSQILREAKERAEEENQINQQKYTEVKRIKNYEALFDDHHGLVHLEALELLSKLCSIKLSNLNNSLIGDALKDMLETLEQVKELCELPEDDDDEKISLEESREIIKNAVKEINIPISYEKLFSTCEEADKWLENINLDFIDDTELHQQAIETLAQLTALAMEQFHKTGELLLVKDHRSTADEADSLVQITTTLKALITGQAGKFSDTLSSIKNANKDNITEHITNIFYEAANSGTYIQDAFQLLIPVLQVGAV